MEHLTPKRLVVSRGFNYSYYTAQANANRPSLLLLHGFPLSSAAWSSIVVDYLLPNGFGVVVVDCLGYSGSSKPTELQAYHMQLLAGDLVEIVSSEGLEKVIVVGHDWGAILAQRLYNFHPALVAGLVQINLAYVPRSRGPFTIDASLAATEKLFGYSTFHYWNLFTSPSAPSLLSTYIETFYTIVFGLPPTWLSTLCSPDGILDALLADDTQPLHPFAESPAFRAAWIAQFVSDGFDAPLNYYRSMAQGVQDAVDKALTIDDYVVYVPYLFIGGNEDFVCRCELLDEAVAKGFLPKRTVVVLDAGHWTYLSHPEAVGETLMRWLEDSF